MRITMLLFFVFFFAIGAKTQVLDLQQLSNLGTKDFPEINSILTAENWSYLYSEKTTADAQRQYLWKLSSRNGDSALAWITVFNSVLEKKITLLTTDQKMFDSLRRQANTIFNYVQERKEMGVTTIFYTYNTNHITFSKYFDEIRNIYTYAVQISGSGQSFGKAENGQEPNWTESDTDGFTTECVKGAKEAMGKDKAKQYCSCMLDKLIVKYPDSANLTSITLDSLKPMAADCLNEIEK